MKAKGLGCLVVGGVFLFLALMLGCCAPVTLRLAAPVEGGAAAIMSDVRGAMPGAPRSIKLAYVTLAPSYVTMRVYRGGIDFDDWIWRDGTIDDPRPARGTNERDAAEVFDSNAVPWSLVPTLRRRAIDAAAVEGGRVSGLTVSTLKGGLQMAVSVHGTRHDATIVFDGKGDRVR